MELLAYLRLYAKANPLPPVDHQIDLRTFSLSMTLPTWQNLGSNIAAAPAHLSTLPFLAPTSPSSLLINHHRRLVEHEERERCFRFNLKSSLQSLAAQWSQYCPSLSFGSLLSWMIYLMMYYK